LIAPGYIIEVAPDTATDGSPLFVARHPELEGCMAHGSTPDEAVENLADARELYLGEMRRRGIQAPAPSGRVQRIDWAAATVIASTSVALPAPVGPSPVESRG